MCHTSHKHLPVVALAVGRLSGQVIDSAMPMPARTQAATLVQWLLVGAKCFKDLPGGSAQTDCTHANKTVQHTTATKLPETVSSGHLCVHQSL